MKTQVAVGKVDNELNSEKVVWRLQKDDFACVLKSTEALIEKEEYEEFFDLAKANFEIETVSEDIEAFLDTTGLSFTDKTSEEFARVVLSYSVLSQNLPENDPADTIYTLKLSQFTDLLLQKYGVLLDEREIATFSALIIEKFNVYEWTDFVATFIDIYGYHSPKEDRL